MIVPWRQWFRGGPVTLEICQISSVTGPQTSDRFYCSTGTVLHEISERKNKNAYECPNCDSEHIVRFGKYTTIVDGIEMDETYFLYLEKGQRKIKGRKPRKRGGFAKKRGS